MERYQDRIVASIKELNTFNQETKNKFEVLEEENEKLKTLLNLNCTNVIIKRAKRETEMKKITENIEKLEVTKKIPACNSECSEKIEMPMPLFFGNQRNIHPKKYLRYKYH